MGTSESPEELRRKLRAAARAVPLAKERGTKAAAQMAKVSFETGLMSVGVTPGVSRMPRKRVTSKKPGVPVKVVVRLGQTGPTHTAVVRYAGPVHWIEGGTTPHPVLSQKAGLSRKGRVKLGKDLFERGDGTGKFGRRPQRDWLATPFGPRAWVQHPGAKARPFWRRVEANVRQGTPGWYSKAQQNALLAIFR